MVIGARSCVVCSRKEKEDGGLSADIDLVTLIQHSLHVPGAFRSGFNGKLQDRVIQSMRPLPRPRRRRLR